MRKVCFAFSLLTLGAVIGGIAHYASAAESAVSVKLPEVSATSVTKAKVNTQMAAKAAVAQTQVEGAAVAKANPSLPAVSGSEVAAEKIAAPTVGATEPAQYKVELPGGTVVTVCNPVAAAAVVVVPQLAALLQEKPSVTTAEVVQYLAGIPEITPTVFEKIIARIPSVADPADRMTLIQEFMRECRKLFRDQRGIQADRSMFFDSGNAKKWLAIYKSGISCQLEHVPLPVNLRMVAEVHHPINTEILNRNLDFYRFREYNAVLITCGYEDEKLSDLVAAAMLVKQKGMAVWFALSGPENLSCSVFQDPAMLREKLKTLAAQSQGFFLGWRRTSLHLFEQDAAFSAFVLKTVREGNPKIAVVGEAYYGQTASSKGQTRNLQYNIPGNASGVLVSGLGYYGVAVETVMETLLNKISSFDKVVLITGDTPYYATQQNNGKSFLENLRIKEILAQRWLMAGAKGITILHGDGSDGVYVRSHNDNIADMEVKK